MAAGIPEQMCAADLRPGMEVYLVGIGGGHWARVATVRRVRRVEGVRIAVAFDGAGHERFYPESRLWVRGGAAKPAPRAARVG